jgi:type IX secretion system PorP/SprF family membrane protein
MDMSRFFTALLVLVGTVVSAQDPVFSQFYAVPMQFNPGFAGSAFAPRMGFIYRNQWTGFNSAYRTYGAFYEQSLDRLNSGIGFNLEGDNAGNGILKTTRFSAVYAYRLHLSDQLDLRLGVEAGLHQTNLNWDKLIFPDQVDALNGITYNSEELRPDISSRSSLDISTGLLLLSEKFYLGAAMKHLNTPREGVLVINDNIERGLPIRYVLHGGTELIVNKGNKLHPPSFISPNFLFVSQGPYQQLNIGAYAGLGSIFCGLWLRHTFNNADAAILMAGFKEGVFKFGLSYDATISGLSNRAGGTFEFSLGISLDQNENLKKKKKRADLNDCLRMFQ